MEGVRVEGIDAQCSVKVLWDYFDKRVGVVKNIYYPLLNNNAVVIFKEPSETTAVLTRKHDKWTVLPLPNQVFSKQRVWVESDLSMLVQATGAYQDSLRNMGQVDIIVDSATQELILTGQPYQIEWAWNYLSSLRDNQFHIARTLQSEDIDTSSKLSNGSAMPGYLSSYEKSHHTHNSSSLSKHGHHSKLTGEDISAITSLHLEGPGVSRHKSSPRSSPALGLRSRESDDDDTLVTSSKHMGSLGFNTVDKDLSHSQAARERRRRQDDANETFSKFASLPTSTNMAASRDPSHFTDVGHNSSSHTRSNAGGSGMGLDQRDLDRAESVHKTERKYQSLDYKHPAEQEDYLGTGSKRQYQSLRGDYGEHRDAGAGDDITRGMSYLATSDRAATDTSPFVASSASVELSRKHFDLGKALKLKIYVDDITKTKTDAVVNAANWELKNIGGVAGALAKAAGPEMADECEKLHRKHGSLATAQVVKTKAYGKLSHLKCVIHTVGPIYIQTDTERSVFELAQTFFNCLDFAEKLQLTSVTFPFISTGIFGMPTEHCILSLVTALKLFVQQRSGSLGYLEEIHFINNDINVVCEAIIMMEQRLSLESEDSAAQRMDEGKHRYGRFVYPFLQSSVSRHFDSERYGTWDSSQMARGLDRESDRNNSRLWAQSEGERAADRDLRSLPSYTRTDPRERSSSLDRTSKTMTAGSGHSKTSPRIVARDPSPRPQPRQRSSSLTLSGRPASSSVKTSPSSATPQPSTSAKHQPVIKKSLTGAATKTTGLAKKLASRKGAQSSGRAADYSGNDTDSASAAGSEAEDSESKCCFCTAGVRQPSKLSCGHMFCSTCFSQVMTSNSRCPKCSKLISTVSASSAQPNDGTMTHTYNRHSSLPGFDDYGTIVIKFVFPSGKQGVYHPNPGRSYDSAHYTAYLPDNTEGGQVLKMLQKAFDLGLLFTIVSSLTGQRAVIVENGITLKTSKTGSSGYPDREYLRRVKSELAAKGVNY